jgi:hypothetical protein
MERSDKAMVISTRCKTVDHFISVFHRFVAGRLLFVSRPASKSRGVETAFVIVLADKKPVLRGVCIVKEKWTTTENPFALPGVKLEIKKLTKSSAPVYKELVRARKRALAIRAEHTPLPMRPRREIQPVGSGRDFDEEEATVTLPPRLAQRSVPTSAPRPQIAASALLMKVKRNEQR